MFSRFANWMSKFLGHAHSFNLAVLLILAWLLTGPYYHYSDAWQLVVNTGTTIVTFLMVFLLQNTQNRDTLALQLKLDEVIRSIKGASNEMLKVEELNDEELVELQKKYEHLAAEIKKRKTEGKDTSGTPNVD